MSGSVALCIDEASCRNPWVIGLGDEPIDNHAWLHLFNSGEEARNGVRDCKGIEEAWVVSCDDVEPINLAATMKSDRPELRVSLVTSEPCGSLFSRAKTAEIDEVIDLKTFLSRYAQAKGEHAGRAHGQTLAIAESASERVEVAVLETPRITVNGAAAQTVQTAVETSVQPARLALGVTGRATRAFMLTVVSGSGGAGKSAVSALGALIAEKMGHRVLLLDCDLQFGDMSAMVGRGDALRIDEALAYPDRLDQEIQMGKRLTVLGAPDRLETAEQVVAELPVLIDRLAGSFDVIVANTGASWAEQHAALLERSSAALFLIDQRASSIRACQHALDLCARCGIATGPFQFALNRCAKGAPLSSVDVSCALQGASVYELKDGGSDVEDYLSGGSAGELLERRNEFAKSLEHVLSQILPAGAEAAPTQVIEVEQKRLPRRRGRHGAKKRGW